MPNYRLRHMACITEELKQPTSMLLLLIRAAIKQVTALNFSSDTLNMLNSKSCFVYEQIKGLEYDYYEITDSFFEVCAYCIYATTFYSIPSVYLLLLLIVFTSEGTHSLIFQKNRPRISLLMKSW